MAEIRPCRDDESDAILALRLAKYEAAYNAWQQAEPRLRALSIVYLDSAADTVVAANTARYADVLEAGRGIQYRVARERSRAAGRR